MVSRKPLTPPSPIGRFKLLTLCDDHGDSSHSHPRPRGHFLSLVCSFSGQWLWVNLLRLWSRAEPLSERATP